MSNQALFDLLAKTPDAAVGTTGAFAAQGRLPAQHLAVEVGELGWLACPVPPDQAQALQAVSAPAHFGHHDQTLLDLSVRDGGEIHADLLGLRWAPGAFAALQRQVSEALGLEGLEAHLHNLLVYGPGQFFKPHQDTEKLPRMVASLVLVLPSAHLGGALRIFHGEQVLSLASQQRLETEVRWFAFFSDCQHEVLPVEEGWRIALTFNLVLPKTPAVAALSSSLQTDVQQALQQVMTQGDSGRLLPWVMLLDHEYTEHGLRWGLLKGSDRWRVAALRQAARNLGLTSHLALAELHQSWMAEPAPSARSRRNPRPEMVPGELIEEQLTLDIWVDAQDDICSRQGVSVDPDDLLSFVETGADHLVNEEYEGYMGNYGETLDYWYRRAALVLMTPLAALRSQFELDFDQALAETRGFAAQAAQPDQQALLASRVSAVSPALARHARDRGRELLAAYADIAAALPDDAAAHALLQGFSAHRFQPEDALALARLEQGRGTAWMLSLLQAWADPPSDPRWKVAWANGSRQMQAPTLWPERLVAFTQACVTAGVSSPLLSAWADAHHQALVRFDAARSTASPANRQSLQRHGLAALKPLSEALCLLPEGRLKALRALLAHVTAHAGLYPLTSLAPWVQALAQAKVPGLAVPELRAQVVQSLQQARDQAVRLPADHSLRQVEWTCRCGDCSAMLRWAESSTDQPLVMPLAESHRLHVQQQIAAAGAPLKVQILKQGSPYKLVLDKPTDLLAQDLATRERWAQELAGLLH